MPKLSYFSSRRRVLLGGIGLLAAPSIVHAQSANGVALIIGNSKYKWEASLPNAKRDATDIAQQFEALGLKTELLIDASRESMVQALNRLKAAASGARLAVFYFAGHGVDWDKKDYLVPVDSDLSDPNTVGSLLETRIVRDSLWGASNRMAIFDNCRNNPADGWRQTEAQRRAAASGAATTFNETKGSVLALYSTAPGNIALDGPAGQNSPFAAALLRQLKTPQVSFLSLVTGIRREILIATKGKQLVFDRTLADYTFPQMNQKARGAQLAPAPTHDGYRVVEIPKAYEFAQKNAMPLPSGLIVIQQDQGSTASHKVGSFKTELKNRYGITPALVVVLSSAESGTASVIHCVARGFNGKPAWRFFQGAASGNKIKLLSRVQESETFVLEWQSDNRGTFSSEPSAVSQQSILVSHAMTRLD
mgnify:CR=1 FL=1